MLPRVIHVQSLGAYRLELTFSDGVKGELNMEARIVGRGGVFKPLEDPAYFAKVTVDPEAGTIAWPNDVDLCPDVLYSLVSGKPVSSPQAA